MKFHTIPPEKDFEIGIIYPRISIIQVGYVSENFQLNIEASKKFDQIHFNESWINYRRTSGAIRVKCHGDRLYASGLKCLLWGTDFVLITKEGMHGGKYNDELLKFLIQMEPKNFQGSTAVRSKFTELLKKKRKKTSFSTNGQNFALKRPDVSARSCQQLQPLSPQNLKTLDFSAMCLKLLSNAINE